MNVSDILERAADRIEPEGRWTQLTGARNSGGVPTWRGDDDAVCWCAFAAIQQAADGEDAFAARQLFRSVIGTEYISAWNDDESRTQSEVVAKLREAAAKAREAGK